MTNGETIEAYHSPVELNINKLTGAEWNQARAVQLTRYWSGEAAPVGRQAEACILWSDQALWVRFSCNQTEPLVISANPQTEKKTMNLWDRDVCEIFIAPDPDTPNRYFEFEAAPTGEWIDLAIHLTPSERLINWEFHSDMTAAGQILKQKVLVGMRIPWDDWIHKPQRDENWRVNLFRCMGKDPKRGYLTWCPTRTLSPNFHVPQAFGWLQFR
jgi:hypothetical protein